MKPFDLHLWNSQLPPQSIIDQIVIDSRRIDSTGALFIALPGKHNDGHEFIAQADNNGARYAIVSKQWQPSTPLKQIQLIHVENPLTALQEIASLYRQQRKATVIAITGSCGKTMIKDLLHAMLATTFPTAASPGSFNSQIGVPLSLLTLDDTHRFALIEAGVTLPGEMQQLAKTILPDHAILTNISKAHAPYFNSLETTAREKMKLLSAVPAKGWALLPHNELTAKHLPELNCRPIFWNAENINLPQIRFTSGQVADKMIYEVVFPSGKRYAYEIRSGFSYILENITIAVKAALLLGVPEEAICRTLDQYIQEPMHTEIWKSPLGPTFINDIYCSDPLSVDLALQTLHLGSSAGRRVFVFGGFRDDNVNTAINYRRVGKAIKSARIDLLVLFGSHDYAPLREELHSKIEVIHVPHYDDAVRAMRTQLQQNDTVLIKGKHKQPIDRLIETWNDSPSDNKYIINLAAISSNISTLKSKLPQNTRIMVMTKAAAYGTDAIPLAKFLGMNGIDILGVSYADEAITLKHAGVTQNLFVLNAAIYEAAKIAKWDLEVGVSEPGLIDALADAALDQHKKIKVHLHIDTGMSRFGCHPEEALELAIRIKNYPTLALEGIMTHLASADDSNSNAFTQNQIARLDFAIESIKSAGIEIPWIHAANSAGSLGFSLPQCNMARIGLAIYGLYPSLRCKKEGELRPALSLTSRIVGINTCKKGDTVSYGGHYKVERAEERIAILPIGYFDGLHRHYSGKGAVIIRGQKAPMVGNICMDYMMVNVTDIKNASVGDTALIFGQDDHGQVISAETLAAQGQSIVHELITCLGPRLPRIFLHQ